MLFGDGRVSGPARRVARRDQDIAHLGRTTGDDMDPMPEAQGFQRIVGDEQHRGVANQFGGQVLLVGRQAGLQPFDKFLNLGFTFLADNPGNDRHPDTGRVRPCIQLR